MDTPKADKKVVDYVHDLHDNFLLSKPLPANPRQVQSP